MWSCGNTKRDAWAHNLRMWGDSVGGGRTRNGEETRKNDDVRDDRPVAVTIAVID